MSNRNNKHKKNMEIPDNAIKVYKDNVWVWVGILSMVVMEALLVWLLFSGSLTTWIYVFFGAGAVICPLDIIFDIVKARNTIVVCPDFVRIERAQSLTKDYKWENIGTVDIEWSSIKQFSKESISRSYYYYLNLDTTNGRMYRFAVMEPTCLFLKRQLRMYHKQYRKPEK